MSKGKIITLSIFIVVIALILIAVSTVIGLTWGYKLEDDKLIKNSCNLTVLDNTRGVIKASREEYVEYENISDNIINAFVTLEDKRFFEHKGLDYKRILSATAKNITSFSFKEGASTISQQLIKNTHLSSEKTVKRKLAEAKLALALEKKYNKDQILEMYLNVIYFGNGMYGIDKVCKGLFNKAPKEISYQEAAVIAGIVKNPSRYSPLNNMSKATERRNIVLGVMLDNAVISDEQYNTAINEPIELTPSKIKQNLNTAYYSNVISEAEKVLNMDDKEIINSNYTIYTYLDKNKQNIMANYINSDGYNPNNANQLSLTIDNLTYGITSYHGNFNALNESLKRQVGSLIKPFAVYAPAFENNTLTGATLIDDAPININGYSPQNYDKSFHGLISAREALMKSYNIPAIKLLQEIGIDTSVEFLSKMNIAVDEKDKNLTLALGTLSLSPIQVASMYTMLANGGRYADPGFISEIYDGKGNCIYKHQPQVKQVVSPETAFIITDILRDCANKGTAQKLKYLNMDIAAKTGTVGADNGKVSDAWVCAYTAKDTVLTWQGAKKELLPSNYGGGGYPTLITKDILSTMPANDARFELPETLKYLPISYNGDKYFYDISSNNFEYFTNLSMPEEIVSNQMEIKEFDGQIVLIAPPNTRYTIEKVGFLGFTRLIYDGYTQDYNTNITQYFSDGFYNKYIVRCGSEKFLVKA